MSKKPSAPADDALNADGAKLKSPLQKMKKAWKKADPAERAVFLEWLSSNDALPPTSSCQSTAAGMPISTGRYLRPSAAARIREIMTKRSLSPGDVMGEMGFDPLDRSLHHALARSYGLRLMVIEALEAWLADNSAV